MSYGKSSFEGNFGTWWTIIVSGIYSAHSNIKHHQIEGAILEFSTSPNNADFTILENEFNDTIGHITAIYGIIHEHCPLSKIFSLKVVDRNKADLDELTLNLNIPQ